MDCQTAQLLLPFLNPRAEPLPVEVARALESHVNQCAACSTILQDSGREDRIIAVAMKDVVIPDGLRGRLLNTLRTQRARRTWIARNPRWAAAAALLFLVLSGALGYWWQRPLPAIDMNALTDTSLLAGSEQLRALYKERGLHTEPPRILRYDFLVSCGWELFQGKLAPRLLFQGPSGQLAEVFILTDRQFDLTASPDGSANIELRRDPNDASMAYVVRSTGGPSNWVFMSAQGT